MKTYLKLSICWMMLLCSTLFSCTEEKIDSPPFTIVDVEGLDVNLYWTLDGKTSDQARLNSDLDVLVAMDGETKFSSESDFFFEVAEINPDTEDGTYIASIRLKKNMEKTNYVMTIRGHGFDETKIYEFSGSFSTSDSPGKIQEFLKIVKTGSSYTFSPL